MFRIGDVIEWRNDNHWRCTQTGEVMGYRRTRTGAYQVCVKVNGKISSIFVEMEKELIDTENPPRLYGEWEVLDY